LKFENFGVLIFINEAGMGKEIKRVKQKKIKSSDGSKENVKEALIRKALGYEVEEIVEEYAQVEGKLELIKKKVNSKYYPPDLSAIEFALSTFGNIQDEYSNYTDEELLQEKEDLIKLFKKYKGGDDDI